MRQNKNEQLAHSAMLGKETTLGEMFKIFRCELLYACNQNMLTQTETKQQHHEKKVVYTANNHLDRIISIKEESTT